MYRSLKTFCHILAFLVPVMSQAQLREYRIVEGNNQFALELYYTQSTQKSNIFLSPISISSALAMLYDGARDSTAAQMKETLHFLNDKQKLHQEFSQLMQGFTKTDSSLVIANAIWGQEGFSIDEEFFNTNKKYYGAGLVTLDFTKTVESRKKINDWVELKTHNKIKDLIPVGGVTSDTRLFLTNAIYFKSNWQMPFNPQNTKDADFTTNEKKQIKTSFMNHQGYFNYTTNEFVSMLELLYTGGKYSMLILLPKSNLEDLETYFSIENYNSWVENLSGHDIQLISIPKFKFEKSIELKPTLSSLGIKDAFMEGSANFSGISKAHLFISNVYHKAFIDVNEQGTEAAAATAVGAVTRGALVSIKEFIANRPFIFIIRDRETNSIIFIGRILNPVE